MVRILATKIIICDPQKNLYLRMAVFGINIVNKLVLSHNIALCVYSRPMQFNLGVFRPNLFLVQPYVDAV